MKIRSGHCYVCKRRLPAEFHCFGCGAFFCPDCEVWQPSLQEHRPQDHQCVRPGVKGLVYEPAPWFQERSRSTPFKRRGPAA